MSSADQKSDLPHQPRRLPPPVDGGSNAWDGDADDGEWHLDSQIAPSEMLSELPQLFEEPAPAEPAEVDEPETVPAPSTPVTTEPRDSPQVVRRRSKTIARKQMLRERRRMIAQGTLPQILDYERPGRRSHCREGKRPCMYVSCRYHLYLDVNPMTGSIKINFPDREVWELEETCALDVAERGGITLEEVGEIMNLTRERIRQVEVSGLDKLRKGDVELHTYLDGHELEPSPEPEDAREDATARP